MPNTAVKCGGAPQKIMYLAEDHFRRSGFREKAKVIFATAQGSLFSIEEYRKTLLEVVERKQVELRLKHNLVELIPDRREAIFSFNGSRETMRPTCLLMCRRHRSALIIACWMACSLSGPKLLTGSRPYRFFTNVRALRMAVTSLVTVPGDRSRKKRHMQLSKKPTPYVRLCASGKRLHCQPLAGNRTCDSAILRTKLSGPNRLLASRPERAETPIVSHGT